MYLTTFCTSPLRSTYVFSNGMISERVTTRSVNATGACKRKTSRITASRYVRDWSWSTVGVLDSAD